MLCDPEKRRRYDRSATRASRAAPAASTPRSSRTSATSWATSSASATSSAARRSGPRRGADLRYNLELTLEEAAFGTETHIQIPRLSRLRDLRGQRRHAGHAADGLLGLRRRRPGHVPAGLLQRRAHLRPLPRHRPHRRPSQCKDCKGQGQIPIERKLQIKIPPGVDTGSQLRITGEGEPGAQGGPRATSTSSCASRSTTSSRATAPASSARCRSAWRRPRSARRSRCRRSTAARRSSSVPEGTQPGSDLPRARPWRPPPGRARPRRPARGRARRGADEAQRAISASCSRSSRRRCPCPSFARRTARSSTR